MNRLLESERGAALILAFMAMTVLMALGTALVLMTSTDTVIAANFRAAVRRLSVAVSGRRSWRWQNCAPA